MNDLVSKGTSGVGGGSPIGTGLIKTVTNPPVIGAFNFIIFVPAGERWLLQGVQFTYSAGSVTTSGRIINVDTPAIRLTVPTMPNINETWFFSFSKGIENATMIDFVNPTQSFCNLALPEIWLEAGEFVEVNGATFDPDTVYSDIELRIIQYFV